MTIRDWPAECLNAAHVHPDELARARCAAAYVRLSGREPTLEALVAIARDIDERVAREVLAEDRLLAGGLARRHCVELEPGSLAFAVSTVSPRS